MIYLRDIIYTFFLFRALVFGTATNIKQEKQAKTTKAVTTSSPGCALSSRLVERFHPPQGWFQITPALTNTTRMKRNGF